MTTTRPTNITPADIELVPVADIVTRWYDPTQSPARMWRVKRKR
jgi:hypothetical protein